MVRQKQDQPENPLVCSVSCIGEWLVRTLQDGISRQLVRLLGLLRGPLGGVDQLLGLLQEALVLRRALVHPDVGLGREGITATDRAITALPGP